MGTTSSRPFLPYNLISGNLYDPVADEIVVHTGGTLYAYEVSNNRWKTVTPLGGGSPGVRHWHTMVYVASSRSILLFSGRSQPWSGVFYADVWIFDLTTKIWRTAGSGSPKSPAGRMSYCGSITSRNDFVVFGGNNAGDTWIFNLKNETWRQLPSAYPYTRSSHKCAMDTSDRLFSFAGAVGDVDNKLLMLNLYETDVLIEPNSVAPFSVVGTATTEITRQSSEVPTKDSTVVGTATSEITRPSTSVPWFFSMTDSSFINSLEGESQYSQDPPDTMVEEIVIDSVISAASAAAKRSSTTRTTTGEQSSLIGGLSFTSLLVIGLMTLALLNTIGIALFLCRKGNENNSQKHSQLMKSDPTTSSTVMSTNFSNYDDNATSNSIPVTMVATDTQRALCVPGYLLLRYGVHIRPMQEIAHGAFGRIFLGQTLDVKWLPSGSQLIIKQLNIDATSRQQEIDSFFQEVAIMDLLKRHRNIAKLYGYTENPYSIIMKYYALGSLDKWLKHSQFPKTKKIILSFASDVSGGLEHMHLNGLCHADLKPQNVLVDLDDETNLPLCVLTDFGITQIFTGSVLKVQAFQAVTINGASVMYAAPEAIRKLRGRERVEARMYPKFDIYSFGVLLMDLVCRRLRF